MQLASLPEKKRNQIINSLSDEEAEALIYDWSAFARPDQLPPTGDWFGWLLLSGRGAGKTRAGAEAVRDHARSFPKIPIALIGQTKADVRDTMIELGESSIQKISPPWFMPKYEPSKRRLTWPNGAVATAFSGDEPGQLRGPQHGFAWVDELAKFRYPQETWDNMEFGLRVGPYPRVIITTTPRPIPIIKALISDPGIVKTTATTYDNIHNLPPAYIERVIKKYEGTRLGRQELYAILLEEDPNALWSRTSIEKNRVTKHPDLISVVVGVDPHASTGETGIVVGGTGLCNCKGYEEVHGFILDDLSTGGLPSAWAGQSVTGYHKFKADKIAAEANHGGDMVISTIHTVDKDVNAVKIWASRGKYTRAEPVEGLYSQGKVHHVGMFADLEDEMVTWVPGVGDSPNRMDALVWTITELMLNQTHTGEVKITSHADNPFI